MRKSKDRCKMHSPKSQGLLKQGRVLAFSLMVVAALLAPIGATAQEGLFQRGVSDETYYGYGSKSENTELLGHRNVQTTGTINNQIFGQTVPVGSGVIILFVAGAGYVALKRKEDKQ